MPSPNELPAKCIECYKSTASHLHRKCLLCNELEFEESDGELSVEELAHRIKGFSNEAILKKFPHIKDTFGEGAGIWDEAYFVETIGSYQ